MAIHQPTGRRLPTAVGQLPGPERGGGGPPGRRGGRQRAVRAGQPPPAPGGVRESGRGGGGAAGARGGCGGAQRVRGDADAAGKEPADQGLAQVRCNILAVWTEMGGVVLMMLSDHFILPRAENLFALPITPQQPTASQPSNGHT